jgi:hypothetical protein
LWRTLYYLWLKPGRLTQEFVAGRRVAFLPPFRLYLVLSIIFFLIASFSHTEGKIIEFDAAKRDASTITSCDDIHIEGSLSGYPGLNQRIKHACAEIVRDNGQNLMHAAVSTMPKAMFIFLPLIAFLHMLLYWRPRFRYAEHLLFFVHLHAFFFSVAIVMVSAIILARAWPPLLGPSEVLETLLGWTLPVYTVIAMRRVFTKSWRGAFFKGFVLFFLYTILFALTLAGVVFYAALQL